MTTTTTATATASTDRHAELFELVQPKTHWKDEIHAFISADVWRAKGISISEVQDAVLFYTATAATFETISHEGLFLGYVVKARGYRRGPAGDH